MSQRAFVQWRWMACWSCSYLFDFRAAVNGYEPSLSIGHSIAKDEDGLL